MSWEQRSWRPFSGHCAWIWEVNGMPEHPEIEWIERTGYPSWMQPEEPEPDEDRLYEERRDEWQVIA